MGDRCEICGAEHEALREQESDGHEKRGLRLVEVRNGMCGPCREEQETEMCRLYWLSQTQADFSLEVNDGR